MSQTNAMINTEYQENIKSDESNVFNEKTKFKRSLVWRNIILMTILHISAIYGLLLVLRLKIETYLWAYILSLMSSLGVQCGAHRLWCHRGYKAKLPLRIILMIFQTLALQNDIFEWSRDHRVHHKYSDTDADPHNSQRGFFFSHIGWLLCRKHPEVIEKGKQIDISDLENDPVVKFQRAFYIPLIILFWGFIPLYVPCYFWGESAWNSWFFCVMLRYVFTLNITWCVNSFAHFYGMKPYDKTIYPVEAKMRHFILGEGFHNYHHAFPWDYSASELGAIDAFNPATAFIDLMASIGWAYDLKKAPTDMIKSRQKRAGDIDYIHRSKLWEMITGVLVMSFPLWAYCMLKLNIMTIPIIVIILWVLN